MNAKQRTAGIITMTSTYNYGATLQAFALQEYVEKLGGRAEVIDHMRVCNEAHRQIDLKDFSKGNLLMMPYKRSLEKGYSNFEKFYKEHMHMGRRYDSDEELLADPPEYDVYISGSDQVWNPRYIREKFYLTFAKPGKKRISYAASLGVSAIPEESKPVLADFLKQMDGISVREAPGKAMIEELTDKKVNLNCDPIYLLDRDTWRSYEKPVSGVEEGYILCYMIYKPAWLNTWLKALKKKTGKKIILVGLNGFRPVVHDKFIRSAGPCEFLWLIDHADAVVTSSFHGTAFSLMFGKPVIAIPDPPRPDRIRYLLSLFGRSQCEMMECDTNKAFEPYDYEMIEQKIKELRAISNDYLKEFLVQE